MSRLSGCVVVYDPFEKTEADSAQLFQLHVILAEMKIDML
jgi:hypothetical protein